jgi:ankyrin repeat protein
MAPNPGSSSTTAPKAPPTFISQKANAAPASVDTDHVELRDMIASAPPAALALKDDIMKLAMHGDEIGIRALLDSGSVSVDFRDAEGLTPLHVWHFSLPPLSHRHARSLLTGVTILVGGDQ